MVDISDAVSSEITKQTNIHPIILKFDSKSMVSMNAVEEVLSVLIHDNAFSIMAKTAHGDDVLHGKYYKAIEMPVLSESIQGGVMIEDHMLSTKLIPVMHVKDSYVMQKDKLVGMMTKRRLQKNQVIKSSDLEIQPIIMRGDNVIVRYKNKNLLIETSGVSLDSGAMGQILKVKNNNSAAIMHGKVISPGVIEVYEK